MYTELVVLPLPRADAVDASGVGLSVASSVDGVCSEYLFGLMRVEDIVLLVIFVNILDTLIDCVVKWNVSDEWWFDIRVGGELLSSTSVVILCKVLLLIAKSGDELISVGKAVVTPCGSALVFVEMLWFDVGWIVGLLCRWTEGWAEEVSAKNRKSISRCICTRKINNKKQEHNSNNAHTYTRWSFLS